MDPNRKYYLKSQQFYEVLGKVDRFQRLQEEEKEFLQLELSRNAVGECTVTLQMGKTIKVVPFYFTSEDHRHIGCEVIVFRAI